MIPAPRRDPWGRDLLGRLHERTVHSRALEGNPLGDAADRPLYVYTPPGYPGGAPYRTLYVLQGFTGQVDMWRNRNAFQPTLIERLDAAIAEGRVPPAVLVFPDAWTRYGGSQYLDSAGTGRYLSYLCDDVVEAAESGFAVSRQASARGLLGKSSGGYGALMVNLLRPDRFGGLAALAPDACFEYSYLPDFAEAWAALRQRGGDIDRFWSEVLDKEKLSSHDHALINAVAMAACYSPGPNGAPQLPWKAGTGELDREVWSRWLAFDPVVRLRQGADALRGKALSLECGIRDEFRLYVGASMIHELLVQSGLPHRFELFDGGHMALHGRYPAAAAYLIEGLRA